MFNRILSAERQLKGYFCRQNIQSMSAILTPGDELESFIREYQAFSSYRFKPEFYHLIQAEEPVLEECDF